MRDAQLLVVAPQGLHVGKFPLGNEPAQGLGVDLLADVGVRRRRGDGHALQRALDAGLLGKPQPRAPERNLVAVTQAVLGDALAADEAAVE